MSSRLPFAAAVAFSIGCVAVLAPARAQIVDLTVQPAELNFLAQVGGQFPPAQLLAVNSSPEGIEFSATITAGIVAPGWLSLTQPAAGVTPGQVQVNVDSSAFTQPVVATAEIVIRLDSAQSRRIPVRLTMTAPGGPAPDFDIQPSSLTFAVAAPVAVPEPKILTVGNAGGGVLQYSSSVEYPPGAEQGWLAIEPPNGSSPAGEEANSHNVFVDAALLDPGTHSATIVWTGNGENSPRAVPVTLEIGQATLSLGVEPASFSFFASEGGVSPQPRILTIRNLGEGTISYQISAEAPWLTVTPEQGAVATNPFQHELRIDISGLTAGQFATQVMIASSALDAPIPVPVALSVGPPARIFTSPTNLDFIATQGMPSRAARTISVVNDPAGIGPWSARISPSSVSWLKLSSTEGAAPGRLIVEIDTTGLGAATLDAAIEISPGADFEPGRAVSVPVRLVVQNQAPLLGSSPERLIFHAATGSTPADQLLLVENNGGPQLNWTATTSTDLGGDWLRVTPEAGTAPTPTRVTADPIGLSPGVYHGVVRLNAGGVREVSAVFVVASGGPVLDTAWSGFSWETTGGGAAVPPLTLPMVNRGAGFADWAVAVEGFLGGLNWLTAGPASGSASDDGFSSGVTLSPNLAGLTPGLYGALVQLRGEGNSSPRTVSAMLRVAAEGEAVPRSVLPGGLTFTADGATNPPPRSIGIWRNRAGLAEFQATAMTFSGGDWLRVSPELGSSDSAGLSELEVSVDPTELSPGVYRGFVSISFGDGVVETAWTTLVVPPTGAGPCTAARIAVTPISPHLGFRARAGRAVPLEVEVQDDCGRRLDSAMVLAKFSNNDPPLPLKPFGRGRYAATWAPGVAALQNQVAFIAWADGLTDEVAAIGEVDGSTVPVLSPRGIVNGASFDPGIAPGTILSAFGRNFPLGPFAAQAIPLPTELGGISLLVGGEPAPLIFVNRTQINAQAPLGIGPGEPARVVIRSADQYSAPEEFVVVRARPGVFALSSEPRRAIAQFADGALSGPAAPIRRGEAFVAYLSGVGETAPTVPAGAPPPAMEPFARATLPFSATVGGVEADVIFLGLAPGFVGLAQINIIVPSNAPRGVEIPLVVTVDGRPSRPMVVSIGDRP